MIRLKKIFYILPVLFVLMSIATSCDKKDKDTTPSSETKLIGITFAANDSFPGLKNASFTIDLSTDTALVYNKDSLPVGTRIDSVVTTFYFSTTIGYALFSSDSDTTLITSADTLNFMPRPCHLRVLSEDMLHERNYNIFVNVHTVDPDLYVWKQTRESLFQGNCDVHAENLNGTILLFTQDGIKTALYRTVNGDVWTGPLTPTGLPKGANVRQIIKGENNLYYAEDNKLYTSADGQNWSSTDYSSHGFIIQNMLFYYNDSVWAVVSEPSSNKLAFATMAEDGVLSVQNQLGVINDYYLLANEHFPISDFCAVTFYGKSGRKRAMIMGGYDAEGKALNSRWNLEWIDIDANRGFYRLENFTIEQPEFTAITSAALVWYDEKMLLFGALEDSSDLVGHPVLESRDEGMNWTIPDSAQNKLPADYVVRQHQAIAVTDDNAILLIGGQNRTKSFSDVWRGKKNSINWIE